MCDVPPNGGFRTVRVRLSSRVIVALVLEDRCFRVLISHIRNGIRRYNIDLGVSVSCLVIVLAGRHKHH